MDSATFNPFPAFMYHRKESPRIVQSPDELAELGSEWRDTPAAFYNVAPEAPVAPAVKSVVDSVVTESLKRPRGRPRKNPVVGEPETELEVAPKQQ